MNIADIIIVCAILIAAAAAIFFVLKRRKQGRCSCGCENCAYKCNKRQ